MEISGSTVKKQVHHGKGVQFIRQTMGYPQAYLAAELDSNQQAISRLESTEVIGDAMLTRIAAILNVPVNLIKNYEVPASQVIIENNTFEDGSIGYNTGEQNNECVYHPVDKIIELSDEKELLLERMLKLEQERNAELKEEMLKYNKELIELAALKKEVADMKKKLG